jgi:uncharacterized protein (DUF2164 family)
MRIQLTEDRRARVLHSIHRFFEDELDEPLSPFRAEAILDFFVAELGPTVYNQGVRDACAHIQEKLGDLEGEVYEPEPRHPR